MGQRPCFTAGGGTYSEFKPELGIIRLNRPNSVFHFRFRVSSVACISRQIPGKCYLNALIVAVYWLLYLSFSLNPLFPGTNELDQVAKIHDVLGTPDQSILQKFKQYVVVFLCSHVHHPRLCVLKGSRFFVSHRSRAIHFNFPQKKGTGISRLIPNCPAPALSLLYQMLAYDRSNPIWKQKKVIPGLCWRKTHEFIEQ